MNGQDPDQDLEQAAARCWFPVGIDPQAGTVHYCHVSRADLAAPAFLDERWQRQDLPVRVLRPDFADPPTFTSTPRFIWHTAFCGSTLLARCLDRVGVNLSLKEPSVLMQIANLRRTGDAAVAKRWLRFVLPRLCGPWPAEASVTIKPTNTANNLLTDMPSLSPGSRHLCLTSDLRTFLTSIARKGEAGRSFARRLFTIFALDGHAVARTDPRQLMQMSDLQIAALAWHMQISGMQAAMHSLPPPGEGPATASAIASMADHVFFARPADALAAVDRFFGLALGPEITAAVAAGPSMRRDAKDVSQAFDPGQRAEEIRRVVDSLGGELDAIIDWSYQLFPDSPRSGRLPNALLT